MLENVRLSLIIPVGPQERTRPRILDNPDRLPECWEIIVSHCNGADLTLPDRCICVRGSSGRGIQLNRAIYAARGHWLWLVHADCLPDQRAIKGVSDVAGDGDGDGDAMLGFCDLKFERDGPWLTRLNALGANLRSRWLDLPYGDQGYLLRRSDFEKLDGFREDLPRGEDLNFLIRARRLGLDIRPLGGTMTTSARRYRERGWLKTTLEHQLAACRLIRNARQGSPHS